MMGEDGDTPELSGEEDDWDCEPSEVRGNLSKWTNYIHGWQQRFMALKDGTLVYYKSSNETDFGCRGAINIHKAVVSPHQLDEMRFDVAVNDCVWYLRANSVEEREKWIVALESYRRQDIGKLKRHGSALSLTSNTQSSNSSKVKTQGLTEKLSECETFKDILCQQIDTLQSYFDVCADIANISSSDQSYRVNTVHPASPSKDLLMQHGLHAVDFKGEAITFKATTTGMLATISYCIELMVQREDQLKRRLEKEIATRKLLEERCRMAESVKATPAASKVLVKGGPDYEEGPHSQIAEEEFYDAVESSLDRMEEELVKREQLKNLVDGGRDDLMRSALGDHRLAGEIEEVTADQLKYAQLSVGPEEGVWELFAEEGEMKMYKREEEVDGMVVDPLKAIHQVTGVTAHELCHYFFDPDVRTEWEHTIENMSVLEEVSKDTLIFLQVHKRIWPAAQRDALFWSHIRRVEPRADDVDVVDSWIVCNKSCEHPSAKKGDGGCLRVDLTVCFLCQTVVPPGKDKNNRKNITCRITYCSVVNPGGWAPATVLRAVYKREYPRFLKRFTQYVTDKTRDKPILW